MENLQPSDIAYFETVLTEQMEALLNRAEQTVIEFRNEVEVSADPLDRAARECDHNGTLRIRDRESRLINKIKITLRKIREGEFGICEGCGENIPLARLKARPVTAHCIQCKTRMESWERVVGL